MGPRLPPPGKTVVTAHHPRLDAAYSVCAAVCGMRTMHVLRVTLRGNASCFDRDTYVAPADEAFTIKITNSAWTLSGQPVSATVLISPSNDPARVPIPGRPGMGTCITSKAVFVAPTITAPDTHTAPVQPLRPGGYVLQLSEGWCHQDAALVVRP